MSSKPVIFCSMICVTVFSTVSADAPGKKASMAMAGGAMGGYCATGICQIASRPTVMIIMAMTQANTGRSRKNFESIRFSLGCWW